MWKPFFYFGTRDLDDLGGPFASFRFHMTDIMPTLKKSLISLDTLGGQWRVVELPHGPGGRQGATGALHQRCGHRALSTRQGMLQGWEANRVSGFGRIVFTIGFKHDGFERNRVTILTHHSNPCPSGCSLCSRPRSSYSDWRRNIRILQRPGSLWTLGTALVDHHGWIVPRGKGGKSPIVAPNVKGLNQKDQFQRGTIQVPTPLDCMMKGSALTPTFSIGGDSNASFGVFCFQLCTPLLVFSIEAYWSYKFILIPAEETLREFAEGGLRTSLAQSKGSKGHSFHIFHGKSGQKSVNVPFPK